MPIKIEKGSDNCNNNIDLVTKSEEMTKKHFTMQTSQLGGSQQTDTQNEQEDTGGGLEKEKVKQSIEN